MASMLFKKGIEVEFLTDKPNYPKRRVFEDGETRRCPPNFAPYRGTFGSAFCADLIAS